MGDFDKYIHFEELFLHKLMKEKLGISENECIITPYHLTHFIEAGTSGATTDPITLDIGDNEYFFGNIRVRMNKNDTGSLVIRIYHAGALFGYENDFVDVMSTEEREVFSKAIYRTVVDTIYDLYLDLIGWKVKIIR